MKYRFQHASAKLHWRPNSRGLKARLAPGIMLAAIMTGACGGAAGPSSATTALPTEPASTATPVPAGPSTPPGNTPFASMTVPGDPPAATAAPTVTGTPARPAATSTSPATVTPTAEAATTRSISAGEWTYDYYLSANSCGPDRGSPYLPVTQMIEEVTGNDGFISDGEAVRLYGFNGGPSLGTTTLRWPVISYQVPLDEPGGIRVEVTHTYLDAQSGNSRVVEVYSSGAGTCELTYTG